MEDEISIYKPHIPDFIVKLYSILEKKQFLNYISWANDGSQVLIRSPKKIQDKVLPTFFRHKHISSFVRQLNIYSFNKVHKISKERNHMYFKNENFKRGHFEEMTLIKRKRNSRKNSQLNLLIESQSFLLKKAQSQSTKSNNLKSTAKQCFSNIQNILLETIQKHPQTKQQLNRALEICERGMQDKQHENMHQGCHQFWMEDQRRKDNLINKTEKQIPLVLSLNLPSIDSFGHIFS